MFKHVLFYFILLETSFSIAEFKCRISKKTVGSNVFSNGIKILYIVLLYLDNDVMRCTMAKMK